MESPYLVLNLHSVPRSIGEYARLRSPPIFIPESTPLHTIKQLLMTTHIDIISKLPHNCTLHPKRYIVVEQDEVRKQWECYYCIFYTPYTSDTQSKQ